MDQSVFENVVEIVDDSTDTQVFSHAFPKISAILKRIPWSKLDWTRSTDEFIQVCTCHMRSTNN
jgi:hypothetical protein